MLIVDSLLVYLFPLFVGLVKTLLFSIECSLHFYMLLSILSKIIHTSLGLAQLHVQSLPISQVVFET